MKLICQKRFSSHLRKYTNSQAIEKLLASLNIVQSETEKISLRTQIGEEYYRQHNFKEATEYLSSVFENPSPNIEAKVSSAKFLALISYAQKNFADATFYTNYCLNVARQQGNRNLEISSLVTLGDCSISLERYQDSEKYYLKALSLATSEKIISILYTKLALLYNIIGNATKEEEYLSKSVLASREIGDQNMLVLSLFQLLTFQMQRGKAKIGLLNETFCLAHDAGNNEIIRTCLDYFYSFSLTDIIKYEEMNVSNSRFLEALQLIELCMKKCETDRKETLLPYYKMKKAEILFQLKKIEESQSLINELLKETKNNPPLQGKILFIYGELQMQVDPSNALPHFKKSFEYATGPEVKMNSLIMMAKCEIYNQNFKKSIKYLEEAQAISKKEKLTPKSDIYYLSGCSEKFLGNFTTAKSIFKTRAEFYKNAQNVASERVMQQAVQETKILESIQDPEVAKVLKDAQRFEILRLYKQSYESYFLILDRVPAHLKLIVYFKIFGILSALGEREQEYEFMKRAEKDMLEAFNEKGLHQVYARMLKNPAFLHSNVNVMTDLQRMADSKLPPSDTAMIYSKMMEKTEYMEAARNYFDLAIKMYNDLEDKTNKALTLVKGAIIFKNDEDFALKCLEEAFQISMEMKNVDLQRKIQFTMSKIRSKG